jgi:hypothetical protein
MVCLSPGSGAGDIKVFVELGESRLRRSKTGEERCFFNSSARFKADFKLLSWTGFVRTLQDMNHMNT